MARLNLSFDEALLSFETRLNVRVSDINMANHLSSEGMVNMISQARSCFFVHHELTEFDPVGVGIMVVDLAVQYRSEAHAHEELCFAVGITDHNAYGADLVFRITRADGAVVAWAKCGFVFFDAQALRVATFPESARKRLAHPG